ESIWIGDIGSHRIEHPACRVHWKKANGAYGAVECPLWQSVYSQPDLLTRSYPGDVALIHTELQNQGISAADGQHQISLVQRGSHLFREVRGQHHPAGGGSDGGEPNLLVEQLLLLTQCVTSDPLEPLLGGITPAGGERSGPVGGTHFCRGCGLLAKELACSERGHRHVFGHRSSFLHQQTLDHARHQRSHRRQQHWTEDRISAADAERPPYQRE